MLQYIHDFYIQQVVGLSYVISDIVFCLCLTLLLNDQPWNRKGVLIKLADFALTFAAMLVINSCGYMLHSTIQFVRMAALPVLVLAHMPFGNCYDWQTRLVMSLVYYSSFVLIFGIAADAATFFRWYGLIGALSGGFDMTSALAILMPVVMTWFLKRFSVSRYVHRHSFETVLILCIVVLTHLLQLIYIAPEYTTASLLVFRLVADSVLWLLELLSYYMLYAVTREYNDNLMLQVEKLRMENDRVITDFSEQNFEELKQLRHDMRNHFAYMDVLLQQGEYDEARKYFSVLSEDVVVPPGYLDCGNSALNAILHFERTRAAAHEVELVSRIAVPRELRIEEQDLCSLLSNLLDNAIEGCDQSGAQRRTVTLNIHVRELYLVIRVANPISRDIPDVERLSLVSTKRDSHLHGYGTKIIRRVAHKYRGICNFKIEDGQFISDVMLEMKVKP